MNMALLTAELRRDEGLRLKPYRASVGILTIGVGRNLEEVGISEPEADVLLRNDIGRAMDELDRALPWWRELDEVRQRVMVNLAFNLGADSTSSDPRKRKLLEFKNTLAAIQSGNYAAAGVSMLKSLWASQVGERAQRLARMMVSGIA